jgi:tRNA (cytidine32/uridine32-2'-O)-methyltransferase
MVTNCFDQVRIVLIKTSHSGNIGQSARAMKNMGLSHLVLVDPQASINGQAISMASGADEILQKARVVNHLSEAIADCQLVFATSARSRELKWPTMPPRTMAHQIIEHAHQKIAIVFGAERSGMTNEELSLCHYHVHIPTHPDFSSLNLSQAVQVMAYELMSVYSERSAELSENHPCVREPAASCQQMSALMSRCEKVMEKSEFLDLKQPKKLIYRMRRLSMRAGLLETEVNILLGFLSSVEKKMT